MKLFFLTLSVLAIFSASVRECAADNVGNLLNKAKLQGSGQLTWWGFHIYDAFLYRFGEGSSDSFALTIHYRKSIHAKAIIDETKTQMTNMGVSSNQAQVWGNMLSSIIPEVNSGDTLTAVYYPSGGTEFLHNGVLIGNIPNDSFARAFFSIWLDPRTQEPSLRESLLGGKCPPILISNSC